MFFFSLLRFANSNVIRIISFSIWRYGKQNMKVHSSSKNLFLNRYLLFFQRFVLSTTILFLLKVNNYFQTKKICSYSYLTFLYPPQPYSIQEFNFQLKNLQQYKLLITNKKIKNIQLQTNIYHHHILFQVIEHFICILLFL